MALQDRELLTSHAGVQGGPSIQITKNKVGTLAAQSGAPKLPRACPLAWNKSTKLWTVYTQPSATVASFTITNGAGTQTDGGTFELLIDGLGLVEAWNVPIATIQASIDALLLDAGKTYTITVAGAAHMGTDAQVTTFTFSEGANSPTIDIDGGGLLDGAVPEPGNYVLAIVAAGTDLNGTDKIRGFIDDDLGVDSSAAGEVQILVALEGDLSRNAINTAAILAVLGGSPTANELDAALTDPDLRALGLQIKDLAGVN